ncbi:50S ribosomal protein L4 [Candidatus Roizmanbacteria bacterium]|nr:50S ribosomal protein L4 [Candidatus Roizmanbacteria bacterium]
MTDKQVKTTRKTSKAAKETAAHEISVYDMTGKVVKSVKLPEEMFSTPDHPTLISQYVRVYLANQRQGTSSTKTRSEVIGSTKKIYRQKGTGRARHGAAKAPIFVGGGVTFGPRPGDHSLSMTKKQKKTALFSALSIKAREQSIIALSEEINKVEVKTKPAFAMLKTIDLKSKKTLLVLSEMKANVVKSFRNIPGIEIVPAASINPYMVLTHDALIFAEDALPVMKSHFAGGEKNEN